MDQSDATDRVMAIKHDQEKVRMELLPVRPLAGTAEVLTLGAIKYGDRNWENGFKYSRPYGALQRHLTAWWGGENLDPEWDKSHLAHAMCCLLMLMEYEYSHRGEDDRPDFDVVDSPFIEMMRPFVQDPPPTPQDFVIAQMVRDVKATLPPPQDRFPYWLAVRKTKKKKGRKSRKK